VVAHPPPAALSFGSRLAGALRAALYAALLALFARAFVVAAAIVPSGSMRPTLLPGDRVLVDRLLYAEGVPAPLAALLPVRPPRAGDVVWLRSPEDPRAALVKRCAVLPGGDFAGRRLAPDELAVLGDDRDDSRDSRVFGPVPRGALEGRVVLVLWSRGGESDAARWRRVGRLVR
jgi:signal peptidase I